MAHRTFLSDLQGGHRFQINQASLLSESNPVSARRVKLLNPMVSDGRSGGVLPVGGFTLDCLLLLGLSYTAFPCIALQSIAFDCIA